jgi:stage II sporulation protein D
MVVSQYSPTGNVVSVTMTDANGRNFVFSRRSQLISALGIPTQRFNIGNQRWGAGSLFANDPSNPLDRDSQFFAIDGSGATVAVPGDAIHALTGSGGPVIAQGDTGAGTGGETNLINGVFTIRGAGRGHSVGMSQWGAYVMAHYYGKSYIDILQFYFTGVDITNTGPTTAG